MAQSGGGPGDEALLRQFRDRIEQLERRLALLEPAVHRTTGWVDSQEKEQGAERARRKTRERQAREKSDRADRKIKDLNAILATALASRPLTFDALKENQDEPAPEPDDYPGTVPVIKRFGPGAARRKDQARQEARGEYEQARDDHQQRMREAADWNAMVEERRREFAVGDTAAVTWFISKVLSRSDYPKEFPRQHQVVYEPERAAVFVELHLPPPQAVPQDAGYQYEPQFDDIRAVRRPQPEIRQQYKRLIASIALRTFHEIYAASAPYPGAVREVVLTGWCTGSEEAVGESRTVQLFHVQAEYEFFTGLQLADVQPTECLTGTLRGRMSPYPYGLAPAVPVTSPGT